MEAWPGVFSVLVGYILARLNILETLWVMIMDLDNVSNKKSVVFAFLFLILVFWGLIYLPMKAISISEQMDGVVRHETDLYNTEGYSLESQSAAEAVR
mmetsp:Transcript_10341/g.14985  ORF Transcript_10341/g.14985 Transcript_10341/m.14985 type:complete len:98 (-) Transcript_10341:298-591(-)